MKWSMWLTYWCGFLAGALIMAWVILSTHLAGAQSQEVADAIQGAAVGRGVSEAYLRKVAYCESRYLPWATSRGGHRGLYQFADGTWAWMSIRAGWAGASPYDPWAAADVAAWAFSRGYGSHWACR